MKLRYIAVVAALVISGCTLQDNFAECLNEGHNYCMISETTGLPVQISCNAGKINVSECQIGCDFDRGVCVTPAMRCEPGTKSMCTSTTTQKRCVELEGQGEKFEATVKEKVYIKRIVECEDDGVCNPMTHRCDGKSEINKSCEGKENYCEGEGSTISHYCSNGTYYMHDCAEEDRVCINGRCVEAPQCDPIQYETVCLDRNTLWTCNEYGQYQDLACGEGKECIGGACTNKYNEGDACDVNTFKVFCNKDELLQCEAGIVTALDCGSQGEDYICEDPNFLGHGPGCYPACDVPGLITGRHSCLRNDQKFSYEACIQTASKRSVSIPQVVSHACFGDSYVSCRNNSVSMTRCAGGCQINADMGYSAQCNLHIANNCQSNDTFGCQDLNTRLVCDPNELVPTPVPCEANERCSEGACVPLETPPVAGEFCNPTNFVPTCLDNQIMMTCNTTTGLYEYVNCIGYSINYSTSMVMSGECKMFKKSATDGKTQYEAACAVPCSGSTCYQDHILNYSCNNSRFIHLTSMKTHDGVTVNRITEVAQQCDDSSRKVYCSGNEMKREPCDCIETSSTTAECK